MALPKPTSIFDDGHLFAKTGFGYDNNPLESEVRTRLVTIQHKRTPPTDSRRYVSWKNDPVQVYGKLRITVSVEGGVPQDELYLEPVSLSCFRSAALEAYDVMADQAEKAYETDLANLDIDGLSSIDLFDYRRQHLVAIPQGTPNLLQPQEFAQDDYGMDLSFARRVLDEALANLATGKTLVEINVPYMGDAQDIDAMNEEDEEREMRAQNMSPMTY